MIWKKFIYVVIITISNVVVARANYASDIIPSEAGSIATPTAGQGMSLLDKVLIFIKDSIFGILGLIAIGMFLYIGFNLVKAQGNPEELKKAFMSLIHVIVGLFIVAISWALIRMVSGIIL